MINCLIVDDEPLARQIILQHLSHFPEWMPVKECINATEAWQALQEYTIDVMFLDIQMPGVDGLSFLKSVKSPPLTIFVTAYPQYAIEGFDLMATDYLLKPITLERFAQAIGRVNTQLGLAAKNAEQTEAKTLSSDHIFLKVDSRHVRINFDEILFAEARRDFSKIYFQKNHLLVGVHLKVLEEMLAGERFMRVHRSFIINISKITSVEGNMIYIDKNEIPVGSSYKAEVYKKLGL